MLTVFRLRHSANRVPMQYYKELYVTVMKRSDRRARQKDSGRCPSAHPLPLEEMNAVQTHFFVPDGSVRPLVQPWPRRLRPRKSKIENRKYARCAGGGREGR